MRECFINLGCPIDEFGLSFPSGSGENAGVKSKARNELPIKSDLTQERPKLFDVGWPTKLSDRFHSCCRNTELSVPNDKAKILKLLGGPHTFRGFDG